MTWVRIEDGFPDHPKVVGLTDRAFRAHIVGLCYAGQHLTDGKIPEAVARGLGKRQVSELVAADLWEQNGVGYIIHGYLDYNPSREYVEDERRKARERRANAGRRGGVRSGDVRTTSRRRNEAPTKRSPVPSPSTGTDSLSNVASNGTGPKATLDDDQTYLADRLEDLWEQRVRPLVADLLAEFPPPTVTEALRRAWGERSTVEFPGPYLHAICTAVAS